VWSLSLPLYLPLLTDPDRDYLSVYICITSVNHKGVTCYGIRGRGVESRSLMTPVETRDLSVKDDRSRVNKNTKRVGKSRHVDEGMFTTVAILHEKSFDQGSRLVLSSYVCVDSGGQTCGGGW